MLPPSPFRVYKSCKRANTSFGFIIRYPEGKENITGYTYEPWHLRYVGQSEADDMFKNDLTFEEYTDQALVATGS